MCGNIVKYIKRVEKNTVEFGTNNNNNNSLLSKKITR